MQCSELWSPSMLDSLDKKLLRACQDNPGAIISEIVKPFRGIRSRTQLYKRFQALEVAGLIEIDRSELRGRDICKITEAGKGVLDGEENP